MKNEKSNPYIKYEERKRRVKETRKCKLCRRLFHRHNGNVQAKYCSVLCARRHLNTRDHQIKAGRAGGLVTGNKKRGTGTKGYIKLNQKHEHRVVAEKALGRKLKNGEVVHHKDGNKHNNILENLEVTTQSNHINLHRKEMMRARKQKHGF